MNERILIIEDEAGIAETLSYSLTTEGFDTIKCYTGSDGLKELQNSTFNLIVLDVGLPDISGFDLLKKIRKSFNIPVIFLTARSEEIDKIIGLELGADDYVTKPFSPREVAARVKAIFRRINNKNQDSTLIFHVDEQKRKICYHGKELDLTRYEFEILLLFIDRPGWVFSRDQIMELIWNDPGESFDRTIDTHIKTIRAKLKKLTPEFDPIETHRGVGYSLKNKI